MAWSGCREMVAQPGTTFPGPRILVGLYGILEMELSERATQPEFAGRRDKFLSC